MLSSFYLFQSCIIVQKHYLFIYLRLYKEENLFAFQFFLGFLRYSFNFDMAKQKQVMQNKQQL